MATMPLRRLENQELVEEKFRQQIREAVDQAIKTVESNRYNEHYQFIRKLDRVSRIVKENPLYTRAEVEAILRYLNPSDYTYKKHTLNAMKALHRYSRENRIDFNSSVIVWKEYL
jgi:hypothetical protein